MATSAVYLRRRLALLLALAILIGGVTVGARRAVNSFHNRARWSNITVVKGQLGSGEVLYDSLLADGISREAANEAVLAIARVLDLTRLRTSDRYRIYLDKERRIVKFVYERAPADLYFAVRDAGGKLRSFKPAIYLKKELLAKEFTITSSLFAAILKAQEEEELVFDIVDIFAWDIDFYTYPRVGDKIKLYYEKQFYKGKFARYGRVLAAEYDGRDKFRAVYFAPGRDRRGYYDLEGRPTEKMFLKTPLKFTGRITSYFGRRRDPFTHRHGHHTGVDFASYYGAPIVATADGLVTFAGWRGAYGRLLIVRHNNGYATYYGHCSRLLARPGQKVGQGQTIALVGSSGRSTGPHCHYEIRIRAAATNPLAFNRPKRLPLKGKELAAFKSYAANVWKNIEKM
ncbi:MAG: peptidoglycan DD-metalloendopeptidase family protein [Candidatus Saganbacteria bacterium]|nr:peptidoglycan DD-metalloendopeptidase family protein [Candidatus Saganbacteria bacterium]